MWTPQITFILPARSNYQLGPLLAVARNKMAKSQKAPLAFPSIGWPRCLTIVFTRQISVIFLSQDHTPPEKMEKCPFSSPSHDAKKKKITKDFLAWWGEMMISKPVYWIFWTKKEVKYKFKKINKWVHMRPCVSFHGLIWQTTLGSDAKKKPP